ncbi:YPDG domain-containing protein [Corynebacterium mayonis]|uniref:YPDG domain-containing protein n=1 Tax=Corynebacterium mayonis TaxID=3062461 RepID=UPI003140488C
MHSRKNGVRRGTTIAAAALSLALVAPAVATVSPVKAGFVGAAQAQTSAQNTIDADAIASGYVASESHMQVKQHVLSGRAYVLDSTDMNTSNTTWTDPVPEGTTVYLRWIDSDGAVSPLYTAKTSNALSSVATSQAGPGAYAFDLRAPWTDNFGREHIYEAKSDQHFRIWVDPYDDPVNGVRLEPFRQAPGFFPGSYAESRSLLGATKGGSGIKNMQRTAVFMTPANVSSYMHKPESEWKYDTETRNLSNVAVNLNAKGTTSGFVWLDTRDIRIDGPSKTGRDAAAPNYEVVLSYLTPQGIAEYAARVESLPIPNQQAAARELLTDHPEYIAETVSTETTGDGYYAVRFNEATFTNETKSYMFGFVRDPEGRIVKTYSPFIEQLYVRPNDKLGVTPQTVPAANLVANPMWYNLNFAIIPYADVDLRITNFNTTDRPAQPGQTALIDVTGILPPSAGEATNRIVWTNSAGAELKVCENITTLAQANECTLTIPNNAQPGEIIRATLYYGDAPLAADSLIVANEPMNKTFDPKYDLTRVVPGTPATSAPNYGEDAVGNDIVPPAGTKYAIKQDYVKPAGYSVEIDENTGVITVMAPESLDKDTIEQFDVPVVVTYPDNSVDNTDAPFQLDTDGDDDPDVTDPDDDNDGVPDGDEIDAGTNPKDPDQSAYYDPTYDLTLVVPGKPATSAPKFKNKAGKDVAAPQGAKYAIKEGYVKPAGYSVEIDENTGVITVMAPQSLDKDTIEQFDVPVVVTYSDNSVDNTDAPFQLDTDGDGDPDVTDPDDDNDGVPDGDEIDAGTNPKDPDQSAYYDPTYDLTLVVPGKPATSAPKFKNKAGNDVAAPEGAKYAIKQGYVKPAGYSVEIDENTGVITVMAPQSLDKDTIEQFDVPVVVTYSDNSVDNTDAPFQLDTDGDGDPDVTDPDDDNDGVPDGDEIDAGTNPKDPDQSAYYDPTYDLTLVVPGKPATSAPKFKNKAGNDVAAPEGAKYAIKEGYVKPAGYSVEIDENTGVITVMAPESLDKDTIEQFDVPVVVTYSDNSVDNTDAPFQLDTDGDGDPDVTDPDDDNDGVPDGDEIDAGTNPKVPDQSAYYDPTYDLTLVVPGKPATSAPKFKNKAGNDVAAPEGAKYAIKEGYVKPAGYSVEIDENTGVITVMAPQSLDKDTIEQFDVPVVVTYSDNSVDNTDAPFQLDTDGDGDPDVTDPDDDNDGVPDGDEIDAGTNPKVPDQSAYYDPTYDLTLVVPGKPATSAPKFKNKAGNDVAAPEGAKYAIKEGYVKPAGYSVEIDENTGVITVMAPQSLDKDTIEQFDVPVVVTYSDNSVDNTDAPFQLDTDGDGDPDVTDPDDDNDGVPDGDEIDAGTNPKDPDQSAYYDPTYDLTLVVPGKPATSAPKFKNKAGNDVAAPEGAKYAIKEGYVKPAGYSVEIDENTGVITVMAPQSLDKDTIEQFDVPVVVTYSDNSVDNTDAPFQLDTDGDGDPDVTDPDDDNDGVPDGDEIDAGTNPKDPDQSAYYDPTYDLTLVVPGTPATSAPKFKNKAGNDVAAPEGAKYAIKEGYVKPAGYSVEIDENTGVITVMAPQSLDKDTIEQFDVPVVVTYSDNSVDNTDAPFQLDTDGDGDPDVTDPDDDNDGYPDGEEIDAGSNPKDPDSVPGKPNWEDTSTTPDRPVTLPNVGAKVPEGSTVATTGPGSARLEGDGSLVVTPSGAAKPGDKIVIVVNNKNGRELDTVTVTIVAPAQAPDWNDTSTTPDRPVTIPNVGGKVPEGTTTVTTGPGTAVLDGNGSLVVTPSEGAKPGDKIVIVVRDNDDKVIDTVTVTIVEPAQAPDWNDTSTTPDRPVTIPNVGGKVPEGTTVVATGPGTAVLDGNGSLVVTPSGAAKPGDKIVIVVRGNDDKIIDTVTVTIVAPAQDPNWNDTSTTPDQPVTIPNVGGKVPEGTTVVTTGPGTAVLDGNGSLVVTPSQGAKPGDKIVIVVRDNDDKVIDTVTVTIVDSSQRPDWNDTFTTPDRPVTIPNVGGKVPEGTTTVTTGPGTAVLDGNGSLVVTPSQDARPGDKIVIVVRDNDDKVIDTVTVTIVEPTKGSSLDEDQLGRCIATSLGFGLPLLGLIPLAIASEMQIPGLAPITDQINSQLADFNAMIQQRLGLFDPALAAQAEQIDMELRKFGLNLSQAIGSLAAISAVVLVGLVIADACTPGGLGSSDNNQQAGSSLDVIGGSSQEGIDEISSENNLGSGEGNTNGGSSSLGSS